MRWHRAARLRRWLAALLAVAWLASCTGEPPAPEKPHSAPDFALDSVDGSRVRLSEHRGKVVILDFWATWCPPCRVAIPHLVELQEKYRSSGLVVVGMNLDTDPEEVARFLGRQSVNYPVVRVDQTTRTAYGGIPSIPQAFVLDRQGVVRRKFMGFDRKIGAQMEEIVQSLLQEEAAAPTARKPPAAQ